MSLRIHTDHIPAQPDLSYCRDSGLYPRDATMLDMDESGHVSVFVTTQHGNDGTPCEVWHRRTLRWRVTASADRDALVADLSEGGRLRGLLDRVHAGHSVEWDGRNHVGVLTADAEEAAEDVRVALEDYPISDLQVWEAVDWLLSSSTAREVLELAGLTAHSTEMEVRAAGERMLTQATADGVHIRGGADALASALRECVDDVWWETKDEEEEAA